MEPKILLCRLIGSWELKAPIGTVDCAEYAAWDRRWARPAFQGRVEEDNLGMDKEHPAGVGCAVTEATGEVFPAGGPGQPTEVRNIGADR